MTKGLKISNRGNQWLDFSGDVFNHVEEYTVKQYGDMPHDMASNFTLSDVKTQLMRYVNRIGDGARGKTEAVRDALKISHYGCMIHALLQKQENETDKFKKKPVEIKAVQITDEWFDGNHPNPLHPVSKDREIIMNPKERTVTIKTLEGDMEANINDWIITGIKGEVYPCRDDIFKESYDPV